MMVEVIEMRKNQAQQVQQAEKRWKVQIAYRVSTSTWITVRGLVAANTPEAAIHEVAEKYRLWGGRVRAKVRRVAEGRYVVDTFRRGFVVEVEEIR